MRTLHEIADDVDKLAAEIREHAPKSKFKAKAKPPTEAGECAKYPPGTRVVVYLNRVRFLAEPPRRQARRGDFRGARGLHRALPRARVGVGGVR